MCLYLIILKARLTVIILFWRSLYLFIENYIEPFCYLVFWCLHFIVASFRLQLPLINKLSRINSCCLTFVQARTQTLNAVRSAYNDLHTIPDMNLLWVYIFYTPTHMKHLIIIRYCRYCHVCYDRMC